MFFRNTPSPKYINITKYIVIVLALSLFANCGDNSEPDPDPPDPELPKIILNPSMTNQEMIGFGGALSWYCDRVTSSPKKSEIIDLIVNDLEADIVRLKNWYYPIDYPSNKSTDQMEVSWFKQHFDATNELYSLIKNENSNIDILFSSWGPPSALKSNGKLQEGTLKKANDNYMYDEFAIYWEDILDNITFSPDYLSIQNEPSYINAGWETCEWRPSETSDFPGYDVAFDKVYEKIKDKVNTPVMIGPESANLGQSSFGNTFSTFADAIKDKEIGLYAYHPYNFNDGSSQSEINTALSMIKNNYNERPNIMSEYSTMSWFKTAEFIFSVLQSADASGYIYWELAWDENNEHAMINIDANGNYELSPYYYLIKHFSKFIHKGYYRIDLTIENSPVRAVAFKSASNNKLSVIMINPVSSTSKINLELEGATISSGYQSIESDLFQELSGLSISNEIALSSNSVTTIELDI